MLLMCSHVSFRHIPGTVVLALFGATKASKLYQHIDELYVSMSSIT
jgi:hypothetical protein